jgi:hypothetical protein
MWTQTHVTGSGGGGAGYSYKGTGVSRNTPVTISSRTTRHLQFILKDVTGRERAFELQDIDIACREGNILSVVWGVKKGKEKGPYWLVRNHDTENVHVTQSFRHVFGLSGWLILLALVAAVCFAWMGTELFANLLALFFDSKLAIFGLLGLIYIATPVLALISAGLLYYGPMGNITFQQFRESQSYRDIMQVLEANRAQIP